MNKIKLSKHENGYYVVDKPNIEEGDFIDINDVAKLCNHIFTKEIRNAKLNWLNFDTKKYERELYWVAIKSFKQGFMKKIKKRLNI